MPRLPEPVIFEIGPGVDDKRIASWVPGAEAAGPARVAEQTLLDTFDGRLARQDLTLWRQGRRGSVTLRLEEPGTQPLTVPLDRGDSDRLMGADLPEGVVARRLISVIEDRALLPRVKLRIRTRAINVYNRDGKSVVRIRIDEPAVVLRRGSTAGLDHRLEVSPILGYDREMERTVGSLARRLRREPRPLSDAALTLAGLPPEGVSSDVEVPLDPGMRADAAMSAICRRLADIVDANRPGALADLDPEFLHVLRVAVRRSRSVLKEMNHVLAAEPSARARADLKWIQEITGPTRDLDVLLAEWPSMTASVPEVMSGDLQPLVDLLQRERESAFTTMRRHLRSRRFEVSWARWRNIVERSTFDGPDAAGAVGVLAGGRIVAVYRSIVRAGAAIDGGSPPEALHDLRKRGKELRYLLELFGAMWPKERVKPLVSSLKALQDVLGHFQDDEIQVHELRSLGPALASAPGGTDSLIALGFVIEELTVRQRRARQDFACRFAEFADRSTRRSVDGTFR